MMQSARFVRFVPIAGSGGGGDDENIEAKTVTVSGDTKTASLYVAGQNVTGDHNKLLGLEALHDNDAKEIDYELSMSGPWASPQSATLTMTRDQDYVSLDWNGSEIAASVSASLITTAALPDAYRPLFDRWFPVYVTDAGTMKTGTMHVAVDGIITFYTLVNAPFVGSGNTGFPGFSVGYSVVASG